MFDDGDDDGKKINKKDYILIARSQSVEPRWRKALIIKPILALGQLIKAKTKRHQESRKFVPIVHSDHGKYFQPPPSFFFFCPFNRQLEQIQERRKKRQ